MFYGSRDIIVPPDGRALQTRYPSMEEDLGRLQQAAGCVGERETYRDGISWCRIYTGCKAGLPVAACHLSAGHSLYSYGDVARLGYDFMAGKLDKSESWTIDR